MAGQAKHRNVRAQRQHLFRADAFGGGVANQRNIVYFRELRLIGGISVRIELAEIPLPTGNAGKRLIAFQQRDGINEAAFAEKDAVNFFW